ncbi:hypothetical protein A2872_01850 [Candidatus Gottesmanbacteria bacterium RIFCSPHIGHO2_01_FULL_42_12]|uniref:Uncharacterized protein n=1 Tax=Candidatus Gottesmanbacteria bacterium RIFCSPHIGHO2_01_FULL_42_12 TaxID=1798377 RepID=A0A1F5Z5V2_9BACT|nr:MAG: hypothetical protein A2872_01850 [Candidatus Gottesmanbacteria bacterium RIFCSPHIGHO2_01_FULL_42_12]
MGRNPDTEGSMGFGLYAAGALRKQPHNRILRFDPKTIDRLHEVLGPYIQSGLVRRVEISQDTYHLENINVQGEDLTVYVDLKQWETEECRYLNTVIRNVLENDQA